MSPVHFRGECYNDRYATHFEKVGESNWFITRSVDIYPHGLLKLKVTDKDIHFREFKSERFD